MLLPDRYREQFTAVGKNLHDYMDIERVDPAYRAHFGDHTTLDLLYDTERMRAQLDEVEPGAGGKYIDWLGRARALSTTASPPSSSAMPTPSLTSWISPASARSPSP